MTDTFGRTNRVVPNLWFRLQMNTRWEETAQAARECGRPIEAAGTPTLWGEVLHGSGNPLILRGGLEIETARSFDQASDFIGAYLIEQLSAWQKTKADFFYLSLRRAVEEFQIEGALAALVAAKEEELVSHIGLSVEGPPLAIASTWRFHDAFETVMVARNPSCESEFQQVNQTAGTRRVGVVTRSPFDWGSGRFFADEDWSLGEHYLSELTHQNPVIVSVAHPDHIRLCLESEKRKFEVPFDGASQYEIYRSAGVTRG